MPALRVLLLLRGAFGLLFALVVLLAPASASVAQALGRNGVYALCDGLLALALAFSLSKVARFNWLFALALVDALIRLAIGAVALAYPDIEARILGSVAFFGAIVTACIALGAVGLIYVLAGRRAGQRGGAAAALFVSACTLLLGVGLLIGFASVEGRHLLIGLFALAIGLCLLVAGFRSKSSPSTFPI
jgi:uncharacterized membrane protein YwaF